MGHELNVSSMGNVSTLMHLPFYAANDHEKYYLHICNKKKIIFSLSFCSII